MSCFWESPSYKQIPRMEGFFFEINQALSRAIINIGVSNFDLAANQIKRFKALVKPSGIFDEICPDDKVTYENLDRFLKYNVFRKCDYLIKNLEQAKAGGTPDLKNVWTEIGSLVFITNKYYMYAKTKVCFSGSYKPASDIFDKEGI